MSQLNIAYDLAARAVERRWRDRQPDRWERLRSLRKRDVAVFTGSYDSVQNVLERLKVPYALDPSPKHISTKVVFANCCGSHARHKNRIDGVRRFVEAGGLLVSSDWSLASVVSTAFPGVVQRLDGKQSRDEVVSVEPTGESVWRDVTVPGYDPQWWLETASYPIEILAPERVRIDAASHELLTKYDAPAVAIRFDWEAGEVFHIISHFWLKRSRVPHAAYNRNGRDFLAEGMSLSDDTIAEVYETAPKGADDLTFAAVQSAVTSTELVASLLASAV